MTSKTSSLTDFSHINIRLHDQVSITFFSFSWWYFTWWRQKMLAGLSHNELASLEAMLVRIYDGVTCWRGWSVELQAWLKNNLGKKQDVTAYVNTLWGQTEFARPKGSISDLKRPPSKTLESFKDTLNFKNIYPKLLTPGVNRAQILFTQNFTPLPHLPKLCDFIHISHCTRFYKFHMVAKDSKLKKLLNKNTDLTFSQMIHTGNLGLFCRTRDEKSPSTLIKKCVQ